MNTRCALGVFAQAVALAAHGVAAASRSGAAGRRSSRRARTSRDERGAGRAGPRHAAAAPELAPRRARRAASCSQTTASSWPRSAELAREGRADVWDSGQRGLGRSLLRLRRARAAAAHPLLLVGARLGRAWARPPRPAAWFETALPRSGRVERRVDRRSRARAGAARAAEGEADDARDPRGGRALPAGRVAHHAASRRASTRTTRASAASSGPRRCCASRSRSRKPVARARVYSSGLAYNRPRDQRPRRLRRACSIPGFTDYSQDGALHDRTTSPPCCARART